MRARRVAMATAAWAATTAAVTWVSTAGVRAVDRTVAGVSVPAAPQAASPAPGADIGGTTPAAEPGPTVSAGRAVELPATGGPNRGGPNRGGPNPGGPNPGGTNPGGTNRGGPNPNVLGLPGRSTRSRTGPGSTSLVPSATPSGGQPDGEVTATYSSPGGRLTVGCLDRTVALLSATPAIGYQLTVLSSGPEAVVADFSGPSHWRMAAECVDGEPFGRLYPNPGPGPRAATGWFPGYPAPGGSAPGGSAPDTAPPAYSPQGTAAPEPGTG